MRSGLAFALAAALALGACASVPDRLGDAIAEAGPREERVVRLAGIVTALSEVVVVTVRYHAPENVGNALACLERAEARVDALAGGEAWWFETEARSVLRDCADVVSADFSDKLAALLTPGLDLGALGEAVDQLATLNSVRLDAVYIAETAADPVAVYRARLAANRAAVERLRP